MRSTVIVWVNLAAACGNCERRRRKTHLERSPQRLRRRAVDDETRMNKALSDCVRAGKFPLPLLGIRWLATPDATLPLKIAGVLDSNDIYCYKYSDDNVEFEVWEEHIDFSAGGRSTFFEQNSDDQSYSFDIRHPITPKRCVDKDSAPCPLKREPICVSYKIEQIPLIPKEKRKKEKKPHTQTVYKRDHEKKDLHLQIHRVTCNQFI